MKFLNRKRDLPVLPVGKEAELVMPKQAVTEHIDVVRSLVELKTAEIESVMALSAKTIGVDWAPVIRNLHNQKELYSRLEVELIKHGG